MTSLVNNAATLVWGALVLATGLSWWLGAASGTDVTGEGSPTTAVALFVVAFFKVRLVILYFMEIRDAPAPLRLLLEGWVVGVCGLMVGMYLFAGGG